jgi:hypothetical protein
LSDLTRLEPFVNACPLIAVPIISKNWIVHELARYRAEIVSELREQQVRIVNWVHVFFDLLKRSFQPLKIQRTVSSTSPLVYS